MKKLRVLVLSDEIDRALYDHFDRSMLQDIDMIISCGRVLFWFPGWGTQDTCNPLDTGDETAGVCVTGDTWYVGVY